MEFEPQFGSLKFRFQDCMMIVSENFLNDLFAVYSGGDISHELNFVIRLTGNIA